MERHGWTRRSFLKATAGIVGASLLAACAPAATTPAPAVPTSEGGATAPAISFDLDEVARQYVTYLDGATPGGTFRMSYHEDPLNLISIFSTGGMQKYIDQLHWSGLVRIAPDGQTFGGDIAERFEVSEDGTEYTFYLRKDVMTHDGQPVTADDVVFSLEAHATPLTGSGGGKSGTNWIVGYEAFAAGDAETLEGVQKIDDFTVKVTLTQALPDWLVGGFRSFVVFPKGVLGELPYEQWKDSAYNNQLPPPGTGPFKLTEWQRGVRLVFERNDDFFRGKPLLDEILIEIIPSFDSIYLALQRGDAEWYDWVTRPTLLDMQQDPNLVCEPDPFRTHMLGSNSGISFNQDQEYLRDIRFRQAVAFAINPEEVAAAQDGGAFTIEHMMPWNWEWSHSPNVKWSDRYTYDPDKAKALLAEIDWDTNRQLVFRTSQNPSPTQLLLIQQLAAVGINVTISQSDAATWVKDFYETPSPNPNWDIWFQGIYGVGPADAIGRMSCGAAFTLTRWCDPEWDAWKQTAPYDPELQGAFYQQADEYIFENLVYVLVPIQGNLPGYGYTCYNSKIHMVTNQFGLNWPETWWRSP